VTPETELIDGAPQVRKLGILEANLSPTNITMSVSKPNGKTSRIAIHLSTAIFNENGAEVGSAQELATKIVRLPWIGKRILEGFLKHPNQDDLKGFLVELPFGNSGLFLRKEPSRHLHRIAAVDVTGNLITKNEKFETTIARFGEVIFGYGETALAGRETLVVYRLGENSNIEGGSLKIQRLKE
jgi:hypothetical protein